MSAGERRIGLYGGTFDPIHRGHVEGPRAALEHLGLERVIYLPTGRPPHKAANRLAPPHARFAMTELALLGDPRLLVSPFELDLAAPAYTVDSIRHFHSLDPGARLHLLIGADSLPHLIAWREWREIVASTVLAILARPGHRRPEVEARIPAELAAALTERPPAWVPNPEVDVSASELRRALAAGRRPPAGQLPGPVLDYVRKYNLYRDEPALDDDPSID